MRNFQDTFETRRQSIISAFSICMTVSLNSVFLGLLLFEPFENNLLELFLIAIS